MSDVRIAIVPVGRVDLAEVEAAAGRVAKVFNKPVELREPAAVPRGTEDATRAQHRAGPFLADLREQLPRLKVLRLVGGATPPKTDAVLATPVPDAAVLVADVDLFTPQTDGVFGELDAPHRVAVISVRRLREAFYRRKADPAKQRARLVKLLLMAVGRLRGLPDCRDPGCAMAPTLALADIDMKTEKYCAACWKRLSTGAFRI